jgi:hypothetical protein
MPNSSLSYMYPSQKKKAILAALDAEWRRGKKKEMGK